jgi:hypothetical protein
MPDHTRRFPLVTLIAAAAFVILAPAASRAQSSQNARDARRADLLMRQRMLEDLERRATRQPVRRPDVRPVYKEVAEDFRQLQLVNYSLAGAADPKAELDLARVRKESSEVRKRASRLKDYLSLPEVEESKKADKTLEIQTPESLRSAVKRLDELVNSFAWNPVFQRPGVVDLEQSTKASRDLLGIIALSEQIRRSAEELGKSLARK